MKPRKTMANRLWKIATVVMILLSVFYFIYELKSIVYEVFIGPTMDYMVKDFEKYTPQLLADYALILEQADTNANADAQEQADAGPHFNSHLKWELDNESIGIKENLLPDELCQNLIDAEDDWVSLPSSLLNSIPQERLTWLDSVEDFSSWNFYSNSPIEETIRKSGSIPHAAAPVFPVIQYLRCVVRARLLLARNEGDQETVIRRLKHLTQLTRTSSLMLTMLVSRHMERDIARIEGGEIPIDARDEPYYRSLLATSALFAPLVWPIQTRLKYWQAAPRTHFCSGFKSEMERLASWRPILVHLDPLFYDELDRVFERPDYCPFSSTHREMWFKWKGLWRWSVPWPSNYRFMPEVASFDSLDHLIRWFPPARRMTLEIVESMAEPNWFRWYQRKKSPDSE
ncbi:hypothetical protein KAI87_10695 [Myxococcota bacterium]|nr:hypothetical protein [Myxococcota bacterium]